MTGRDGGAELGPIGNSPVVILVRPQLADNIGAVARAMGNGGLFELRLVAPRDGWPQEHAWRTASGADRILDSLTVHDTVAEAGRAGLLVQSFTDEHDHSKLATPEYAAVFRLMMKWLRGGQKPSPAALAAECGNAQKVYGEACHFDPEFRPRPLSTRVYPRVKPR